MMMLMHEMRVEGKWMEEPRPFQAIVLKTTVNKITIIAINSISLSAPQESATQLVCFTPK